MLILIEPKVFKSEGVRKAIDCIKNIAEVDEICDSTTGDMTNIATTFDKSSVDIVTASSVGHEVYLYGKDSYDSVTIAIGGVASVLKSGGFFAFRGIFSFMPFI
jgi:hypothetical protein